MIMIYFIYLNTFQRGLYLRKWKEESMYLSAIDMYVCIRSILEFTGASASRVQCKLKKIKISSKV
jgi:hypothetical protein